MTTVRRLAIMAILLILWLSPSRVLAHGVEGTVYLGGLAVACRYSSGEAMSYAKVTIFPPQSKQPFQVGHADKNGRFCFYPDALGKWRVTANDGMGHRLEVTVPVTSLDTTKPMPPLPGAAGVSATSVLRVLSGLAVIFGISGCLFWWQGIKLRRSCNRLQT